MSSSEDEFDPDSDSKRFDPSKIPDLDNLLQGQPLNILFNGRFYGARIKRVTRYVATHEHFAIIPSHIPHFVMTYFVEQSMCTCRIQFGFIN